jgi:hypothetical protein
LQLCVADDIDPLAQIRTHIYIPVI